MRLRLPPIPILVLVASLAAGCGVHVERVSAADRAARTSGVPVGGGASAVATASTSPTSVAPGLPTVTPTGSPISGGVDAPATGGGGSPQLEPTTPTGSAPASGRGVGLAIALSSAASFALSGSFGHALLDLGWSPTALVSARVGATRLIDNALFDDERPMAVEQGGRRA